MTVIVRTHRPQDLAGVIELLESSGMLGTVPQDLQGAIDLIGSDGAVVLVAEADGRVVGHLLLTRATLVCDDGAERPILTLAPMAVLPEWQGRGVGSSLVRAAVERATAAGELLVNDALEQDVARRLETQLAQDA